MSALAKITKELHHLRQRHSHDVIAIGRLLVEAKKQLPHGEWLPWLRKEFAWSRTSADRFIRVFEKFGKDDPNCPTLGNLNLEPSTLYLLAEEKTPPTAIKAVLDLVKDGTPLGHKDAVRIVKDAKGPTPPKKTLPPAPKLRDADAVREFQSAISSLSKLAAKSASTFAGVIPPHELEMIASFLRMIVAAERKAA